MTDMAVVMARGLGTRMQREQDGLELDAAAARVAEKGLKALIPLNGRPFLDYLADGLLRAGFRRICLVVAPDADEMRREARRISAASGAQVDCAVQEKPRGTADAVRAAEGFVGGEEFLLTNGDNLFAVEDLRRMADLPDGRCAVGAFDRDELARRGNIAPERVKSFAVLSLGEDDGLRAIVEKPENPERFARDGRLLVNMNLYRFTPHIFEYCRAVQPDPQRGELELTAAVTDLIADGEVPFDVAPCRGAVLDLTGRADIPRVERALEGRELSF